ncbi:sensor histidine kinase N-terminal domain-containing protein [soil metagenome]
MKREQRSLFGEILDWMLAPLLLLWPISVGLTWLVAQDIANRPFDRELGEVARVLSHYVVAAGDGKVGPDGTPTRFKLTEASTEMLHGDDADAVRYQLLDPTGRVATGEESLPLPPDDDQLQPGELRFRDDVLKGVPVRVAYLRVPLPNAAVTNLPMVQVTETLGKRSRLASEIIKGVILPQFVILPLAVLLVWLALARGIAPLNELQRRIRSRDSHDLSPIDEFDAPEEVSPLVRAINDLLARLDQSITAQKHFLADAAHQLKTPLAGLRTQAELAQREIDAGQRDPAALKKSLQQIARSSQRAAHMVNQLLAMARAEDREHTAALHPVNLTRLATDAVQDFVPRALEKRIDLGFEQPPETDMSTPALVNGQPLLLSEMIRNLVDNALQYTPAGGTVTVRVVHEQDKRWLALQVEDSGPGIPHGERELVFHPFYRALGTNVDGSGLGLAIVRQIALHHQAEITIEDADLVPHEGSVGMIANHGPGARFTVRFAAVAGLADSGANSATSEWGSTLSTIIGPESKLN